MCKVERTLVDSVKMQSAPEDEQCEHFELDGVPSPAEYQEEVRQSRNAHTTNLFLSTTVACPLILKATSLGRILVERSSECVVFL
jgi:hypothetical protein